MATSRESASTMCVCGVIGYAQITSGRQRATVRATASEPSSWLVTMACAGAVARREPRAA